MNPGRSSMPAVALPQPLLHRPHAAPEILGDHRGAGAAHTRRAAGAPPRAAGAIVSAATLPRRTGVARCSDGLRSEILGRLFALFGPRFALQETLLAPHAPAVAAWTAIRGHDSVAGNQQRYVIARTCRCDGTDGLWLS